MSKLRTILFLTLSFAATPSQAQTLPDGFYLTTNCSLNATYKRANRLDEQRTVCLAQQPILSIREIDYTTDIVAGDPMRYFDVHLTAKATQQLTSIKASIHNAIIALVIDDEVVFLIEPEYTVERILRIIVFTQTPDLAIVRNKIVDHVAKAKSK